MHIFTQIYVIIVFVYLFIVGMLYIDIGHLLKNRFSLTKTFVKCTCIIGGM